MLKNRLKIIKIIMNNKINMTKNSIKSFVTKNVTNVTKVTNSITLVVLNLLHMLQNLYGSVTCNKHNRLICYKTIL